MAQRFFQWIDQHFAAQGFLPSSSFTKALNYLRERRDGLAVYLDDADVPIDTNNTAERAVRMPKVKQEVSGCFRTLDGAGYFCVSRSCLATLRKQGHNMLAVLQHAFAGTPIQCAA